MVELVYSKHDRIPGLRGLYFLDTWSSQDSRILPKGERGIIHFLQFWPNWFCCHVGHFCSIVSQVSPSMLFLCQLWSGSAIRVCGKDFSSGLWLHLLLYLYLYLILDMENCLDKIHCEKDLGRSFNSPPIRLQFISRKTLMEAKSMTSKNSMTRKQMDHLQNVGTASWIWKTFKKM